MRLLGLDFGGRHERRVDMITEIQDTQELGAAK